MKTIIFCVLFSCFYSSLVHSTVTIQYVNNTFEYKDNPRISDVLKRVRVSVDFYWHGASLYDLDDPFANQLQQDVLFDIERILNNTGAATNKHQTLTNISSQVLSWKVAKKLPIAVDLDLLRVRDELDARLDDGRYLLHLPFRVHQVTVVGAVDNPTSIEHKPMQRVQAYFDNGDIEKLEYADNEFVFVIHPNGKYRKVSLGIHSREHVEVPPGGIIYVPIRELPFDSTNANLNLKIAQLAGNLLP